jgi:hypothetical protein
METEKGSILHGMDLGWGIFWTERLLIRHVLPTCVGARWWIMTWAQIEIWGYMHLDILFALLLYARLSSMRDTPSLLLVARPFLFRMA